MDDLRNVYLKEIEFYSVMNPEKGEICQNEADRLQSSKKVIMDKKECTLKKSSTVLIRELC